MYSAAATRKFIRFISRSLAIAIVIAGGLGAATAIAGDRDRGGYKPLYRHGGKGGGSTEFGGSIGGFRNETFESRLYRSPSGAVLAYPEIRATSRSGFYGESYGRKTYDGYGGHDWRAKHRDKRRDRGKELYDAGYGSNPAFFAARRGAKGAYDPGYGANSEFYTSAPGWRRFYDAGYGANPEIYAGSKPFLRQGGVGSSVRWRSLDRRPHIGYGGVEHRRFGSNVNYGNIGIVNLGEQPTAAGVQVDPSAPLVEGDCPRDEFCSVRLGPYRTSPKIITVNSSGTLLGNRVVDEPQTDPVIEAPESAKPKVN
jgi:hypothetical protein